MAAMFSYPFALIHLSLLFSPFFPLFSFLNALYLLSLLIYLSTPSHFHLSLSFSFCCFFFLASFVFFIGPCVSLRQSAPLRRTLSTCKCSFRRCCRHKNACSKHKRAVFIINQLYGPLMEVISVKFMQADLRVLS